MSAQKRTAATHDGVTNVAGPGRSVGGRGSSNGKRGKLYHKTSDSEMSSMDCHIPWPTLAPYFTLPVPLEWG